MRHLLSLFLLGTMLVVSAVPQTASAAEDFRKRWKATDGGAANTEFIKIDDWTWISTDDNGGRQKWTVTDISTTQIDLVSRNAKGLIYGYLTFEEHGYRMNDTPLTRIPGEFVESR